MLKVDTKNILILYFNITKLWTLTIIILILKKNWIYNLIYKNIANIS